MLMDMLMNGDMSAHTYGMPPSSEARSLATRDSRLPDLMHKVLHRPYNSLRPVAKQARSHSRSRSSSRQMTPVPGWGPGAFGTRARTPRRLLQRSGHALKLHRADWRWVAVIAAAACQIGPRQRALGLSGQPAPVVAAKQSLGGTHRVENGSRSAV